MIPLSSLRAAAEPLALYAATARSGGRLFRAAVTAAPRGTAEGLHVRGESRSRLVDGLMQRLRNLTIAVAIPDTGDIPLALHAVRDGEITVLQKLIAQGVDINKRSRIWGNSALMYAAGEGDPAFLHILLQHGAIVDMADENGATALTQAIVNGRLENVRLLVAAGARISPQTRTLQETPKKESPQARAIAAFLKAASTSDFWVLADFRTGDRHGFQANGSALLWHDGTALCCTSGTDVNSRTPGILKDVNLIPGQRYRLHAIGSCSASTAYLYVGNARDPERDILWARLPAENTSVEVEFTAPDQGTPLSICPVGVVFDGPATCDRSFRIEHLSLVPTASLRL